MANGNVQPNRQLRAPARADFRAGRYLRAADLQLEQAYRLERARRHNRLLHEWGIVCGLWVAAAADPARPWALYVCPGFAIGPYGDEIEVRERTLVNVRDFLWAKPPEGKLELRRAFVAIRYRERPRRLAALPGTPCACDHPEYAASRVADGFEVEKRLIIDHRLDLIAFTSVGEIESLLHVLGDERGALDSQTIACYGPMTAGGARERNIRVDIMPDQSSAFEHYLRAIEHHFRKLAA